MKAEYKAYEERMKKSVASVAADFAAVRAGRANASVLDRIMVDYYGTPTPIHQIASIGSPDPRTLTIQPWDAGAVKLICKAIQESDLGINPVPQRKQGGSGSPVFLAEIQLAQPPFQPLIAHIVALALADHRLDGLGNHAVCHQQIGQKGQVFIPYCRLKSNAGSRNEDGRGGPEPAEHRPGQIGRASCRERV